MLEAPDYTILDNLDNSRAFYAQYAQAKAKSVKNTKVSDGTKQRDPKISLGNGLALRVSAGHVSDRHKYGAPKMAILTTDRPLESREGKTCHWGDYPTFMTFYYYSRKDLLRQLDAFMRGERTEEQKGNEFGRETLVNYRKEIRNAKEALIGINEVINDTKQALEKTSTPEAKKTIEADLAKRKEELVKTHKKLREAQQNAQRVYRDLQTFVDNMPDDALGYSGNSTDKATIRAILNDFKEFKLSAQSSNSSSRTSSKSF